MTPKFRIAAITDEFSPDLSVALNAMKPIGMTGAELRVVEIGRASCRERVCMLV